jgi:mandelate racemase
MADTPRLTVRDLRVVAVEVPMTFVLGTSRGAFSKAPLILIDLQTEDGITGRSYLWCYVREIMPAIGTALETVAGMVKGDRVAPQELWQKLAQRFALMGVQGIVRMAMAGLDVAAWDAVAIAEGKPAEVKH